VIATWAATVPAADAFHALQQAGVAAAPCTDDAFLARDAHVRAREWIRPLSSRDVGTHDHLGSPFRGLPMVWERGAPTLGQDNDYVFKQVLGLDDREYARLVDDGVAIEDYLDSDGNPY
jgi:crotonobetainyl-CoA:carnitine CoA-transferase CaiB-like acyl-CoA transferase